MIRLEAKWLFEHPYLHVALGLGEVAVFSLHVEGLLR